MVGSFYSYVGKYSESVLDLNINTPPPTKITNKRTNLLILFCGIPL